MATAAQKELKKVVREAKRQGWRIEPRKSGALLLYAPDAVNIVTAHATPSDHRAMRNMIAEMRRYGFKWEGR